MPNCMARKEEVEQRGLPVRGNNSKKRMFRKALEMSSSTFKISDVDEILHLVRLSTPKQ